MKTIIIDNHACHVLKDTDKENIIYWGIQPDSKSQAEKVNTELQKILKNKPYTVVAYEVCDWFADFSPWQAPAAFGDTDFNGCGKNTLSWLEEKCIPEIELQLNLSSPRRTIAGYSLSGLFSLWALYESNLFNGAISCSGSLWFQGWEQYITTHSISNPANVYLSLGKKEEKTNNPIMSSVGDMTRMQYDILTSDKNIQNCVLEWNPGGHFNNPEQRIAKSIAWILSQHQK